MSSQWKKIGFVWALIAVLIVGDVTAQCDIQIFNVVISPPSCNGVNDGSIAIELGNPYSTTDVYNVVWKNNLIPIQYDNNVSSSVLSGVGPGSYAAYVTNQAGECEVGEAFVVPIGSTLDGTLTVNSHQLTPLGTEGEIEVVAFGGTPPYTYSLDNGPLTSSPIFSGLTAGNYCIATRDVNGCLYLDCGIVNPFTCTSTPAVTSTSIVNATCAGYSNGIIGLEIPVGAGPYTFDWSHIPGTNNSDTIYNLSEGQYVVVVSDTNGCQEINYYWIREPSELTYSVVETQVSCPGANDGVIEVVASGGSGNYTYDWTGSTVSLPNAAYHSNLPPMTWYLQVSDDIGCNSAWAFSSLQEPDTLVPAWFEIIPDTSLCSSCTGSFIFYDNYVPLAYYLVFYNKNNIGYIDTLQADPIHGGIIIPYLCEGDTIEINSVFDNSFCATGPPAGQHVITGTGNNLYAVNDTVYMSEFSDTIIHVVNNDLIPNATDVSIIEAPHNGFATDLIGIANAIYYYHNYGCFGVDSLVYQVSSTSCAGYLDTATIYFYFTPIGAYFVPENDTFLGVVRNVSTNLPIFSNDSINPDYNNLVIPYVIDSPSHGNLVNLNGLNLGMNYTPADTAITDSFTYALCADSLLLCNDYCDTVTVYLNMDTVNNPPTTSFGNISVLFGDTICDSLDYFDIETPFNNLALGLANGPLNGNLSTLSPGWFCYTPDTAFVGIDSFDYFVCDDGVPVLCDTNTIYINVSANSPPVANDYADQVAVNSFISFSYNNAASDPDGNLDFSSGTIIDGPNYGSVSPTGIGSFNYFPNGVWNVIDTLQYMICDVGTPVYCDTAFYYIQITASNTPLIAVDDTAIIGLEDQPLPIPVLVNDSVFSGVFDTSSIAIVQTPNIGGVTIGISTGILTYTNFSNQNGYDVFYYSVCNQDVIPTCDTAGVFLYIYPDNDAPVAASDFYNTSFNTPVNGDVSTNDFDVDDVNLTFSEVAAANNGVTTMNPDGSFVYTPNPGFLGCDSFDYQICDDGFPNLCDTTYATICVIPGGNLPPNAVDDTASCQEDSLVVIDLLLNDSDPDGTLDPPSTVVEVYPYHGSISISSITGELTYTSDTNYFGLDSLTYIVCDDGVPVLCDTAQVFIDVTPVNDAPIASNDTIFISATGQQITGLLALITFDVEWDVKTYDIVSSPGQGLFSLGLQSGQFYFTADASFSGVEEFYYEVCDDGIPSLCDTGIVYYLMQPSLNLPPVAVDNIAICQEDSLIIIDVLLNDSDPDGNLDFSSLGPVANPQNGSLTVNSASNTITYTPNLNYYGLDTFLYSICDLGSPVFCDTALVTVNVLPVNDPPIGFHDTLITTVNTLVTADVFANDTDVDNTTFTYGIIVHALYGTHVWNANGSFTYEPNLGFAGIDSTSYYICDTEVPPLCDTAWIYINVSTDTVIVWPGDANSDGIADNFDVLPLGTYFGDNGSIRPSASNAWVGQLTLAWDTNQISGADVAHVDCDGSGQIGYSDVDVVNLNYGQIHSKTDDSKAGELPIIMRVVPDTAFTGDTILFDVLLGTSAIQGQDIYGVAYSINFDNTIVSNVLFDPYFSNSWLTPDGNRISLVKPFHAQGVVDVAHSRIDGTNVSGQGHIASIAIVIEDDINGKNYLDFISTVSLSGVKIVRNDGSEVDYEIFNDVFVARQEATGINTVPNEINFTIVPNPASDRVTITLSEQLEGTITMINAQGRMVHFSPLKNKVTYIDLKDFPTGVYFVKVQSENYTTTQKVIVSK